MKTENHYTETDLGNISLNPRGEYDPEAFYEYLDTVSMDGGSYMCLAELGTKITGTPPVPGINTEHWQILTLPGGLTPEYITMHDEVIEKAKQVEVSRAAVELSQSEIEAMQADVAQLHKDTQDSAQSALASKNQAAGYASAADTSRQAAERAKQDIDAQIPNIDAKLQAALNEIDSTRQSANSAVKKQEELSVQAVKDQTGTYITEQKNLAKQELDEKVNAFGLDVDAIKKQVSDEGAKQVEAVRDAQNTATKAVETAKTEAVQAVQTEGTTQTRNVTQEGEKQVQAVRAAAQEIVADREQIQKNKAGIEALKQGKADAIVEMASGEIIQIEDSSGLGFEGLRIFGKSMQDGVPSPESPVPIVNVGDKGTVEVEITGKNLLNLQCYSAETMRNLEEEPALTNNYGTEISTTEAVNKVVIKQKKIANTENPSSYENGFMIFAFRNNFVIGKLYNLSFDLEVINNPLNTNEITLLVNGSYSQRANIQKRVKTQFQYQKQEMRQFIELRCSGMDFVLSNIMITEADCDYKYEPYHDSQSLTISTQNGLPGVKVDSDGNYTDNNGQQWICDEIDLERGKYVQRVGKYVFDGTETASNDRPPTIIVAMRSEGITGKTGTGKLMTNYAELVFSNQTGRWFGFGTTKWKVNNAEELKAFLKSKYDEGKPVEVQYILASPIERDLTPEEIAAYKALHTNYPTTVISNDESAYMEVSYVADTKNYIDKKFKELSQAIVNTQIALL
jgi:hypothetical protein